MKSFKERATLKHRNGSKHGQILARYAKKDPNAKRALEDQIRLGRELVEKYSLGQDASGSSDDEEEVLTANQLLEVYFGSTYSKVFFITLLIIFVESRGDRC